MKNIPVLICMGMFFFCIQASAYVLELATDLYEKQEWELCIRECKRASLMKTEPIERFQLLHALSAFSSGKETATVSDILDTIIQENRDPQVTAIAAYERGRQAWQQDEATQALELLSLSFQTTTNTPLFLRSSCSLFLLMKEFPELKEGQEHLISQINTSRNQWHGALFAECAKPDSNQPDKDTPNLVIRFYRSQISPAIGSRCVLEPSCSEYFHQAQCKHGLLAIPMMADRLFREPEVSNHKEFPVVMKSGQIRYQDPIENHDFWMKP